MAKRADKLYSGPISVRKHQRGSRRMDFREILYWTLSSKSIQQLNIWLQSDKTNGKFTRILKYVYTVDSSTNYFVARQQGRGKP